MNNYFLSNPAIEVENFQSFKDGFEEIIPIKAKCNEYDHLFKHTSIWDLNIILGLFSDPSLASKAVLQFIEQLKIIEILPEDEIILDRTFPAMLNAFLGIDFSPTKISANRQIKNVSTFLSCRNEYLWDLNPANFWNRRKILFPNVILCGEVEDQIKVIGGSRYFLQIIEKLKILNCAINGWRIGSFSYSTINRDYSLNISPESVQTMSKYSNERLFSLPNGRRELFELHIKTGDLRFHIFPDNFTRKVYVGYIGPHLTTVSG